MLDSSAKVPAGLLKLNLGGWMGDFEQCLEISSDRRKIKGKYCLGTLYINIDQAFGAISVRRHPQVFPVAEKIFAGNPASQSEPLCAEKVHLSRPIPRSILPIFRHLRAEWLRWAGFGTCSGQLQSYLSLTLWVPNLRWRQSSAYH